MLLGGFCQLLLVKIFGLCPHAGVLVLQLEKGREQVGTELLGGFPWEEGGEMVDGDDVEMGVSRTNFSGNCRAVEGGVHIVNWYRVVGVGGIAADVDNNGETAILSSLDDLLGGDEGRDGRREIYAVDEDVDIQNLLEWSTLSGFSHIPLVDVVTAIQ